MVNPALNGQTKWLLWLSGAVLTIMITGMTILSNGVITNERERISSDRDILDKHYRAMERVSRLEECVMAMKGDFLFIRTELSEIRKAVSR
jgi:hypothetical protein